MVFKCPVVGCITNYDCYDRGAVFSLPEKEEQKKQLDVVFKSKGFSSIKSPNICYKYFADYLQMKGLKRTKLQYECKPVPTIIPVTRETKNLPPNAIFETIETPKKPPGQKIFQEDK